VADSSVIEALKAALRAAPDDDAIRRHLGDLLVGDGRAAEALGLYQDALQRHADDTELIRAAALAARLSGQLDEAKAYERALGDENGSEAAVALAPNAAVPDAVGVAGEQRVVDGAVPSMTLADVGGLEEVKSRLNMAFLTPARDPELSGRWAHAHGARSPGVLMGPEMSENPPRWASR
jgi:SpoVK/Ycf46/Vps4 family AAA+-type ATPase